MPILIKGSGGAQEAPVISVSSSGLITATAGDEKTTKQLSSSDDTDFVAGNIKSGVSIFGKTGSLVSMDVVKVVFAAANGDGSKTITFVGDFPELSRVVDIQCAYAVNNGFVEDNAVFRSSLDTDSGSTISGGLIRDRLQNYTQDGQQKNVSSYSYSTTSVTLTVSEYGSEFYQDERKYLLRIAYM